MTPNAVEAERHSFPTAIGICSVSWRGDRITGFRLPNDGADPSANAETPLPESVRQIAERVRGHLSGRLEDFADLPFAWETVSAFQRAVYEAALKVKPGTTRTYGWIAREIGQPLSASRAVGTALGQNPWPLLVPCHRFVGADGKMTGFSAPGGIKTKLRLLALEGAELFGDA